MASLTWCTWVWVNSRSWWWTGRPGVLRFIGSQRVGHDWATELNWTEWLIMFSIFSYAFWSSVYLLWKNVYWSALTFFDWDVGVFVVKLQFFIILCILDLIRYMIYKYFSHSFDCLFTFLTVSFDVWKVLIFMKSNVSDFLLSLVLLVSYPEKAMAPHSSTLAWKIPWMEEPGRLQSMGSRRVGHNWMTSLSLFTFLHWRRKWQPTPVFLPGESQGWGSLVGFRLWGRTESDSTEAS